jgi:Flp pilus assembly protein protease CpaA
MSDTVSAYVLAAGESTVLGIFLVVVLVGGFVAVAALWYFMVYRASRRASAQPGESHESPREPASPRDDPGSSKD